MPQPSEVPLGGNANPDIITQHMFNPDDAILVERLKQILATPGISDKDRKQIERNLKRLGEARQGRANS